MHCIIHQKLHIAVLPKMVGKNRKNMVISKMQCLQKFRKKHEILIKEKYYCRADTLVIHNFAVVVHSFGITLPKLSFD